MKILCECNSFNCKKTIDVPFKEALEIRRMSLSFQHRIIIVEGCPHGAELTDTLISKKCGYSIYQEQTNE